MSHGGVVAIDGPAGSGKSTVARGVAAALALRVLDTGAMYRTVTLAAIEAGAALDDEAVVAAIAQAAAVEVEDGVTRLGGRDVSEAIRGPAVTEAVSIVAAHPSVRQVLVERQRQWADRHGGGVVEGRDITTVVFPDACVKVYLTASDEERARRRHSDEADAARDVEIEDLRSAMARRDALDSARAASPLRVADDALVIDTTCLEPAEVVRAIVARFRAAEKGDARQCSSTE